MPRERTPIGQHGTISTRAIATKKWEAGARVRDSDGVLRKVRAHAATKAKAENALKAKLSHRTPPTAGGLTPSTTVTVAARKWLTTLDQAPTTVDSYTGAVERHVIPLIGALTVQEVTASRAKDFLARVAAPRVRRGETIGGPAAAKTARVALSGTLAMCVADDVLAHNPLREVKAPTRKRAEIEIITAEDIAKVRTSIQQWGAQKAPGPPRNAALLLDVLDVLAGTGARPGEVLALRWEDIDLTAGTLQTTGTIVRAGGKLTRKDGGKTASATRTVHLPAFVVQVLRQRAMATGARSGPVFASRAGGWIEMSNLQRLWRQARGKTWEHITFRHYRRAVATIIAQAEGMEAAAGQLGHSSPEVTRRHYAKRAEAVDFSALVAALGPGTEVLRPGDEDVEAGEDAG